MSIIHPERMRECKRCGNRWYALQQRIANTPVVGLGFTRQAQANHMQTQHQQRIARKNAWSTCPSCGSHKVKTVKIKRTQRVR